MNPDYPLLLDLSGRRAIVVGGGPVAARRARAMGEAGARVDVVAPWACEDIWELHDLGQVRLIAREYERGDLDGTWLVHTATGDATIDRKVADDAAEANIWCVRADDAAASTAWTPAVAREGDVVVAVSAGGDPRRATALRDAIRLLLELGELPVRRVRRSEVGHVALVGGGPGDPGLITTRGRRLLAEADVVVVDGNSSDGTKAIVERLQKTILHEHWRIAFRRQYFTSRRSLQGSLDRFLQFYNVERTHRGYRLRGRTPATVFLGAIAA